MSTEAEGFGGGGWQPGWGEGGEEDRGRLFLLCGYFPYLGLIRGILSNLCDGYILLNGGMSTTERKSHEEGFICLGSLGPPFDSSTTRDPEMNTYAPNDTQDSELAKILCW